MAKNNSQVKQVKPEVGESEIVSRAYRGGFAANQQDVSQVNANDFFGREGNRTLSAHCREMEELDPHLHGLMQTRKLSVIGFDRQVTGDGPVADHVRENLGAILNMDSILIQMLSAIPAGFSVAETIWGERNGKFWVEDIRPRLQDKFLFDQDWELCIREDKDMVKLSPMKFLITTYMGECGNRYGSALYQKLYWFWHFKRHTTRFWSIYTERFASPLAVGKYPKNASKEEKDTLKAFLKDLKSNSTAVLPEGFEVDMIDAQKYGTLASFREFNSWLKSAMAIAILGQPGTTDDGANGSFAKVAAQDLVRQDLIKADISMLESVINDYLIKWMVDLNFPGVTDYPKWRIIYEEKPDPLQLAQVVNTLVQAGDGQIPVSWIHKRIGIPEVKDGEPTLQRAVQPTIPAVASFAEMQFKLDRDIYTAEIKR